MWVPVMLQIFLKGRAQRHSTAKDKHAPPDFVMEGNRSVTYGKISHQVMQTEIL